MLQTISSLRRMHTMKLVDAYLSTHPKRRYFFGFTSWLVIAFVIAMVALSWTFFK